MSSTLSWNMTAIDRKQQHTFVTNEEEYIDDESINFDFLDGYSNNEPSLTETDPDSSISFSLSSDSEFTLEDCVENTNKAPQSSACNDITFVFEPPYAKDDTEDPENRKSDPNSTNKWYDPIFNFFDVLCSPTIKPFPTECNKPHAAVSKSTTTKRSNRIQNIRNRKRRHQRLMQDLGYLENKDASHQHRLVKNLTKGYKHRPSNTNCASGLPDCQSMDEECEKILRHSNHTKKISTKKGSILNSSFSPCLQMRSVDVQNMIDFPDDISEDCYDSDPGDFTYRRTNVLAKYKECKITFSLPKREKNQNNLKIIMNNITNVILHKPQENNKQTVSPVNIQIWIERGTVLESKVIEPKLMWSVVNGTIQKPMSIPLMDIYRILPLFSVDRVKYPFARTQNTFLIRSASHGEFLFETRNQKERDTIVKLLKLVIARLASQAFVNDSSIFEDYFQVNVSLTHDKIR